MICIPRKKYEGELEVLANKGEKSVKILLRGNGLIRDSIYPMSIDEAYELIDLIKEAIDELGDDQK